MIVIVDYGMGNLGSLHNMLRRIGVRATVSDNPDQIARATKLLLPGVGAFDAAMSALNDRPSLREALDDAVLKARIPILGVCLGMQLLMESSEEGRLTGLGWISGKARRFPSEQGLRVPHMGWNTAKPVADHPVLTGLEAASRYYFVHSFYVKAADPSHALMRSFHGVEFDSAVARENIVGVQFHPEKSHRFGMALLRNYVSL